MALIAGWTAVIDSDIDRALPREGGRLTKGAQTETKRETGAETEKEKEKEPDLRTGIATRTRTVTDKGKALRRAPPQASR